MKKKIFLTVALLISGGAYAKTEEFNPDALDANKVDTITYAFEISREDQDYDHGAWSKLVSFASEAEKRGIAAEKGEGSNEEAMDAMLKAIAASFNDGEKYGICGNFGVLIGDPELDSEDVTKDCGGVCGGDDHRTDK